MGASNRLKEFFLHRYPLQGLAAIHGHKTVPEHRYTIWYYLGGMTLVLIFIQFASGLLLLLYYRPTVEGAYESVRFIMTKVEFGWLVRSVHAWASHLCIFSALIHLLSAFFLRAYRPPRELTWVSGVFLLMILFGFGFTGYLLPWNTLSFFATKVGTQIAGSVPFIGEEFRTLLRGGREVGDPTLGRFFWMHIAILPIALASLLGLHLLMVQSQGMSKPLSVRSDRSMPFFPNFLLRDLIAWSFMLGVVLSMSVYWPTKLGVVADPFASTPAGILPEWYFLWMFQTLKLFPGHVLGMEGDQVAIVLMGLGGLVVVLLPWLDRSARRGRSHWLVTTIGVLVLSYALVMTVWAWWMATHGE